MKHKIFSLLLCAGMMLTALAGCGQPSAPAASASTSSHSEAVTEADSSTASSTFTEEIPTPLGTAPAPYTEDGAVTISSSDASFTIGTGVNAKNEPEDTYYDETNHQITSLGQDSVITYTIPEGIDGSYDLYLTISKVLAQHTSQYFTFQINDEPAFSVPTDAEVPADSEFRVRKDGDAYDTGVLTDSARFPILEDVSLKTGDTLKITATFPARSPKLKGVAFPAVGDLLLAPVGSTVPTGYDDTYQEAVVTDPSDPLSGKHLIWLGSSETYGYTTGGQYSIADAIADLHTGSTFEKYAISGTTLVNESSSSYVARLKMIPTNKTPDLMVVCLSTNDAMSGKDMGVVSDSLDPADFDDKTIAGAIETIIAYTTDTFHCPVVFYTNSMNDRENYPEMIDTLKQIQKKWDIGVIDLYSNDEMTALYGTDEIKKYMNDEVHPTRLGYTEWWAPVIDDYLTAFMAEKNL